MTAKPGLGFPAHLEGIAIMSNGWPTLAMLDLLLQRAEAFERDGEGILDAHGIEHLDDGLTEEGPVHASFNRGLRQCQAHLLNAVADKGLGAVGIVDVAGSVEHIEHLTGLGDGTEQGIVAALALFLAVETDGGPLGKAAGTDDGAIEVERDGAQFQRRQSVQHHLPEQALELRHAFVIGAREGTADGGHIGEAFETGHPLDHRIVRIETQLTQ